MTTALISHPDCGRHDTGWDHPEHPGRLRAIPRALRDDVALFHQLLHHEARHATVEELELAHDRRYIDAVQSLSNGGGGRLDPDTVVSDGSWAAVTAAVGAILEGVDMACDGRAMRSFCAVRPPGHHALRANAMGFCLFGGVAVAAHYARAKRGLGNVLIVDWDVHHGNGTQALVEPHPEIRFVSMHQSPWYPGTGAAEDRGPHRNVFNVPLPGGLPPERYVDELDRAVDRATVEWTPEIVLISAGFDSLRGDPLGGFTLELEHIAALTEGMVRRAEAWCGGRVISVMEGGYAPDRLAAGVVAHLRALL
ncbi:MAG: histone deacetylase family protein [Gemmatimonadota bacterium]